MRRMGRDSGHTFTVQYSDRRMSDIELNPSIPFRSIPSIDASLNLSLSLSLQCCAARRGDCDGRVGLLNSIPTMDWVE